jgi:hypothetical protein
MVKGNVFEQLKLFTKDCVTRRNSYWEMYYRYSKYNNYLSVPLLLFSSLTGITSVSQVSSESMNPSVTWATAVMGTLSTFLAATQRYLRYGERAEQCKSLAKGYGDLARRIEITLDMYEDGAKPEWGVEELGKFAEEVVQEIRNLMTETQDMPDDMLQKESSFETPSAVVIKMPEGRDQDAHVGGYKPPSPIKLVVGSDAAPSSSSVVEQTSKLVV